MAIYEVDGVHYDIETDDPEVAKVKIREHLGMPTESANPDINVAPQAASIAKNMLVTPTSGYPRAGAPGYTAGPVTQVVKGAGNMALGSVKDIGKLGSIVYNNVTPGVVGEMLGSPVKYGKELASAYIEGHPWAGQAMNMTPRQAVQGAGNFARNLGSGLVAGAVAPESLMALPYQAAAYEQEKIRQNPTAPEYATNPYAQMYRGEAPTQGAAGAMNRRNAIAGQQYGGVTPEEQSVLQQDALNRAIRLKAAQKVLAPVAPTGQ